MSQSPSDSEQQAESPQSKIHQNNSGFLDGGLQAINGGNNNSQYQDNRKTYNYYDINPPPTSEIELPEALVFKSPKERVFNYIKTIFFLFSVFISWSFMGLFAKQAFPGSLANSLLRYTFDGFWNHVKTPGDLLERTSFQLWEGIRRSIKVLPSLSSIEFTDDKNEAERLNKLDSQYWLLVNLTEGFQKGSENSDDIFWKVRELEEQRNAISSRLEPLKKHISEI